MFRKRGNSSSTCNGQQYQCKAKPLKINGLRQEELQSAFYGREAACERTEEDARAHEDGVTMFYAV